MTTKKNPIEQEFYPLEGGYDTQTPALTLKPGKCFDANNYEPVIDGGYARIDGYERYDGRASPSAMSYWILVVNPTGTIAVGNTLTGVSSGATSKVIGIFPITGSTQLNIVIGALTGAYTLGESVTNGVVVGTVAVAAALNGALLPSDDADYMLLAANLQRQNIAKVPGSGRIRGVWCYKDIWYAFRDNVGATAGLMYKATAAGWVLVPFGRELAFTAKSSTVTITIATPGVVTWTAHGLQANQAIAFSTTGVLPTGITAGVTYYVLAPAANTFTFSATVGGAAIATTGTQSGVQTATLQSGTIITGATVTGATSGATGVVQAVLLRVGTWTNGPAGTFVFSTITGAFTSGETLLIGGTAYVNTTGADTAITRLPGGSMEFVNYNFTGSTLTQKMYGVDGVNNGFEFDGTLYVPIHTGMAVDTPAHVYAHKMQLFMSFAGSVQFSGLGLPYSWTVVLGAGEIALGDTVSGFLAEGGSDSSGSALAIFTSGHTSVLYGSTAADFKLVTSIYDIGYSPFTMQNVSNNAYGMTARGIQALITTLSYGDFDYASVSHQVQAFINAHKGLEISSCALKSKNQYRVYYSDNYALAVGLTGDKVSGMMPLNYGRPVRCICTTTLSTGIEVTMFGSDDGYVYQDSIGTSFDGQPIEAWLRLPFNHSKSPRTRKTYRYMIIEGVVTSYSQINISYDLGYGNPDVQPSTFGPDTQLVGGGGYWDQFTWDKFIWDSQVIGTPTLALTGTEVNISFLFYSNRAQDRSHTLQGLTLIYSPRRLAR